MVELLAPAGSKEALIAAIESGANAIYLAGNMFGARAYADNFDEEGMREAIRIAHLRNVLINVTVNTIVDDQELHDHRRAANDCEIQTADRVQDLQLAGILIGASDHSDEKTDHKPKKHSEKGQLQRNGEAVRQIFPPVILDEIQNK